MRSPLAPSRFPPGRQPQSARPARVTCESRPSRHDAKRCRSEENTSELQSLMRISYAVLCLKKKNIKEQDTQEKGVVQFTDNLKKLTSQLKIIPITHKLPTLESI